MLLLRWKFRFGGRWFAALLLLLPLTSSLMCLGGVIGGCCVTVDFPLDGVGAALWYKG